MSLIVYNLIAFLIALCAFIHGAVRLFKHKKPLYFKLLICSVGCYALAQLSALVLLWCDMTTGVGTWVFGIFGCGQFLLSANYGTFDSLVDDGSFPKARYQALAAPMFFTLMILAVAVIWRPEGVFSRVIMVIMLLPSVPASYFSLKHLLLPVDDFGLLKGTRTCDIIQLAYFFMVSINTMMLCFSEGTITGIIEVLISLILYLLTLAAIKGETIWKT